MKKLILVFAVLFCLAIPSVNAATVSISQPGADSGTLMKGVAFTVTVSGLSGTGTATITTYPSGFSLSGEDFSKSFSTSTISWTTGTINQVLPSGQKFVITVQTTGEPEYPESSTFSVVLPPSLSTSHTPTSYTDPTGSDTINLNVQNVGGTDAKDVVVTLTLPSGVSRTSGSSTQTTTISKSSSWSTSWTVSFGTLSAGTHNIYIYITPSNADSKTITIPITVTAAGPDEEPAGPEGPGGPTGKKVSKRPELVPGVGLRNNTKLQAALEKVLAKGKMSEQAIENLIRLSASIISDLDVNKTLESSSSKSNVTVKIKYSGTKTMKNFVVWEKIPKTFAQSSDNITVTAPGSSYEIVEKDPEYVFVYSQIDPNQEVTIFYSVNRYVSESAFNDTYMEVYAESLEEPEIPPEVICNNNGVCEPDRGETVENCPGDCVPGAVCTGGDKRCSGNVLEECVSDGSGWSRKEICKYGCSNKQCNPKPIGEIIAEMDYTLVIWTIAGIVVILIAATGIYLHKRRNKFGF